MNIESLIKENRNFFDGSEPSEGHFDRFQAKLEVHFYNYKRVRVLPYLLRAAAVAILVTLSSLWSWEHIFSPDSKKMTLSEVSAEYGEVEKFYVQQVNLMEDEIMAIPFNNDGQEKEMLMAELDNMDTMYEGLQKDLKANPNDERVINAMIEHYQKKVDVMIYILAQLKEVSNENQTNNEDYETVRF